MLLNVQGHEAYAYSGGRPFDPKLPTVVFLHGAQHDHSVWILQSRYLAHHGYGVLAVDLPGHVRSAGPAKSTIAEMAEWLVALLDAAGVNQACLVGHSMGSLIALETAGRFSDRISKIALVGSAVPMRVGEVLLSATREDEPAAQDMVNIWSHSTYAAKPSNPGPGFWIIGENLRLMQRVKPGVMHIDFAACNAYLDGLARAATLEQPVLLVLGQSDVMTPVRGARELQAKLRNARTVVVPKAGHNLMAEAPDAVLDALGGFLAARAP